MTQSVITKGSSAVVNFVNENIKSFVFQLTTDGTFKLSDYADVQIKITQKFPQKSDFVIYQGTLLRLLRTLYGHKNYFLSEITKNVPLDFGVIFDTKNGKEIEIEVKNNMYPATAQTSTFQLYSLEGVGKQAFIPQIEYRAIDSTKTQHSLILGNDIAKMCIQGNITTGADVFDSVFIKSDKLDIEKNQVTIQAETTDKVNHEFVSTDVNPIYFGIVQNDVTLDLRYTSADTERELYIFRAVSNADLLKEYVQSVRKHNSENTANAMRSR